MTSPSAAKRPRLSCNDSGSDVLPDDPDPDPVVSHVSPDDVVYRHSSSIQTIFFFFTTDTLPTPDNIDTTLCFISNKEEKDLVRMGRRQQS